MNRQVDYTQLRLEGTHYRGRGPISAELHISKKNYSIFGLPGERVQLLPGRRDRHGDLQPQGASLQDGIGQEPQLCGLWSVLAEIRTTRSVLRKI